MTHRFVWRDMVFTERGGELLIGGNPSPRNLGVFAHCQAAECYMTICTEDEYAFHGWTIADHLRLFPLTSVFCEDIIHHVGKFLVSGEHGTYLIA